MIDEDVQKKYNENYGSGTFVNIKSDLVVGDRYGDGGHFYTEPMNYNFTYLIDYKEDNHYVAVSPLGYTYILSDDMIDDKRTEYLNR